MTRNEKRLVIIMVATLAASATGLNAYLSRETGLRLAQVRANHEKAKAAVPLAAARLEAAKARSARRATGTTGAAVEKSTDSDGAPPSRDAVTLAVASRKIIDRTHARVEGYATSDVSGMSMVSYTLSGQPERVIAAIQDLSEAPMGFSLPRCELVMDKDKGTMEARISVSYGK